MTHDVELTPSSSLVLGRYRLGLLVPVERARAVAQPSSPSAFAGEQIAIFRRNVNPAFHDSVAPILEAAGISLTYLPESSLTAMLQFGQRTGHFKRRAYLHLAITCLAGFHPLCIVTFRTTFYAGK